MISKDVLLYLFGLGFILVVGAGVPFLIGFIEGRSERRKNLKAINHQLETATKNEQEEKLIREIAERQYALNQMRQRSATPVKKVILKYRQRVPLMWAIAILTACLAIGTIIFTDPWSRGNLRNFREAVGWVLGIFYGLLAGFPITAPTFSAIEAFIKSREKMNELPSLISFCLPFLIAFASVAIFFYGVIGRHY